MVNKIFTQCAFVLYTAYANININSLRRPKADLSNQFTARKLVRRAITTKGGGMKENFSENYFIIPLTQKLCHHILK